MHQATQLAITSLLVAGVIFKKQLGLVPARQVRHGWALFLVVICSHFPQGQAL